MFHPAIIAQVDALGENWSSFDMEHFISTDPDAQRYYVVMKCEHCVSKDRDEKGRLAEKVEHKKMIL